jgi:hypothetical protein
MRTLLVAFATLVVAAATGCSSPSPALFAAAWNLNLSSGPSGPCNLPNVSFGTVTAEAVTPIVDREDMQWSVCTVAPADGGAFTVTANTSQGTPAVLLYAINIPSISPDATPESPATGKLGIEFPSTATGQSGLSGTCNFFFRNPGASAQGVGRGRFWSSYTCPSLTLSDSSGQTFGQTCAVTESEVAYLNCPGEILPQ